MEYIWKHRREMMDKHLAILGKLSLSKLEKYNNL